MKHSLFKCVGTTEDGKPVYKGVFKFFETMGLPLDSLFYCILQKGAAVSWIDFYKEARIAGMEHDRILSKLEESVCDVWGEEYWNVVKKNLNLVFISEEEIIKLKPLHIIYEEDLTDLHLGLNQSAAPWFVYLYRPVGGLEHHLIVQSGNKKFPPRLSHQPIFYPVTSEDYAIKIAKDWNTKDKENGSIGYVVRFKIKKSFLCTYKIKTVGGKDHQEYWIPSGHMDVLNDNIVDEIETIHVFRGDVDNK